MKTLWKTLLTVSFVLGLASCQSVWQRTVPNGEIVYQGEGIPNSSGHMLGFVQSNGEDNQILEPDRQFAKPVWSADGNILFGLTGSTGSYMGYPAFWDIQNGRFGVCNQNLPYFHQVQGSGNLENPYEVIVQNVWTVVTIDLTSCKQTNTWVDYSTKAGFFSVAGFSYYSASQVLVYGEIENPYDQTREFRLVHKNVLTGTRKVLVEGINPSWSPDGSQIAYIGLDGLYVMDLNNAESTPRQVVDRPFFDPSEGGSPWSLVTTTSWSPDGKWLVYHRCNMAKVCTWEDSQIYKVPSNGGKEELILNRGEYPSWRP